MIYSNGPKTARFIKSKKLRGTLAGPRHKPPMEACGLVAACTPKRACANRLWHSYRPSPDPCGPDTPCPSCEGQKVARPKACGYPYPASPIPNTCERTSPCLKQFPCQAGYRFPFRSPLQVLPSGRTHFIAPFFMQCQVRIELQNHKSNKT